MNRNLRFWILLSPFFTVGIISQAEWTVEVDASATTGPSLVKRFMAVQGSPMGAEDKDGSNAASRNFETAAWKALGPTTDVVYLIDPGQGMNVVRATDEGFARTEDMIGPLGPKRDLYIDTHMFDVMQDSYKELYGNKGFSRVFSASYMPKTLSSNPSADNFQTFPPADYAEWRAVLEAAVKHLNKRGIDDPVINVFSEPESDTIWNVLGPDGRVLPTSTEPVLREYVRLWAESQRAVKKADPGAKVLGMCSGVYSADLLREVRQAPDHKGLDDFIAYVAEYNQSPPEGGEPVELDNICWQGYCWKEEKRMTPMVEHIQATLAKHGFNPDTPHYIMGWSGGWASAQGPNYPLGRYASHLVYNVIDQINPGGKPGPIALADYYTWNLEDEKNKSSLVRTVHRPIAYDGVTVSVASSKDCVRPAYLALVALKKMEDGNLLKIKENKPELARSMATVDRDGINLLLVNYTDSPEKLWIHFKNLPKTARVESATLRVVPKKEICGTGEWFPAKDPVSLLTQERFSLALDSTRKDRASGTFELKPDTVAFLHIPGK